MTTNAPERKPFSPEMNDKRNLVIWVKDQFPELDAYRSGRLQSYPEFEQRFDEVHQAAMIFLDRIQRVYHLGDGTGMYEYYQQDLVRLPDAFNKKDSRKYADALHDLVIGIECE